MRRFALLMFRVMGLSSYFEIVRNCIYVFVYNSCQVNGIRDERGEACFRETSSGDYKIGRDGRVIRR